MSARKEKRPGQTARPGRAGRLALGSALLVLTTAVGVQAAGARGMPAGFSVDAAGSRAQAWIERQCALGPRVPGTAAHTAWIELVSGHLRSLGISVRQQRFRALMPGARDSVDCTNLFASVNPGVRPRLLLGAHWDSRPWADRDPNPANRAKPVPGANDGASGVAALLVLAETLQRAPAPLGIDLAFFDAEDMGREGHPQEYSLGSQYMARTWRGPLPDWVLVLDLVGSERAEFGIEEFSEAAAPAFLDLLFRVAEGKGYRQWNRSVRYAVADDHLPFQYLGVPAIDLIDFHDPVWHTVNDTPAHTSATTLGRVIDVVATLIYEGHLAP